MAQNSLTVWLDQTFDRPTAEINRTNHLSLCKVDPYLVTFHDTDECVDYIAHKQDGEQKVILLISSKTPFQSLDALLHLRPEFSQIDSIYVLYSNETDIAEDGEGSSGIYTSLESLCNHLRQVPTIQRHRREEFFHDDFTLSSLCRAPLPSTSPSLFTCQLLPLPATGS